MSTICGDKVSIRASTEPDTYRPLICTLAKDHEEERHADGEWVWDHRCAWKKNEAPAEERKGRRR